MAAEVSTSASRRLFLEMGSASAVAAAIGLSSTAAAARSRASRRALREVAYVCNSYGDTISVIDVATDKVTHNIAMNFGSPHELNRWPSGKVTITNTPMNARFTLDGRHLWVPNPEGKNIAIIDVATNAVVTTVNLPMKPCDVAFTPDGTQAVTTLLGDADNKQGAFGVIDVAAQTLTRTTLIGTNPEELALTSDGARAFAVSKSLWVYNVAKGEIESELHVPHRCYDALLSPDGSSLYLSTLYAPDKLVVVKNDPDPVKIRISGMIDANVPTCMAFSRDEQFLFVTSAIKSTIQVIELKTSKVIKTAPLPSLPSFIALTQKGDRAYVCHSGGKAITVIDTSTLNVLGSIPTGEGPSSVAMGFV